MADPREAAAFDVLHGFAGHDAVAAHLFQRHFLHGDQRGAQAAEGVRHLGQYGQAARWADHQVVGQQHAEGLIAHQVLGAQHGMAQAQ